MKYVLLASLLTMGCEVKDMSNEEIIKQNKICHDAGLQSKSLINDYGQIYQVQCAIPGENKK